MALSTAIASFTVGLGEWSVLTITKTGAFWLLVIGSYLSGIVVASREKDNAGKPGFSCALLSC